MKWGSRSCEKNMLLDKNKTVKNKNVIKHN